MGRFIISPEKFASLEADANNAPKHVIKSFTKTGEYTGVVDTSDCAVDFNYDPSTNVLNFTVGKKHSLAAKMAPDNVIERHITEVLFNLESAPSPKPIVETPEPVTEPKPNIEEKPVSKISLPTFSKP